jgi:sterol desaturase/sphingolipid hydroxylase (fatty acid hydroxylase superfamily)
MSSRSASERPDWSLTYTRESLTDRARTEELRAKRWRGLRLYGLGPAVLIVTLYATGSVVAAGLLAIVAIGVSHGLLERSAPYLAGLDQRPGRYWWEMALGNLRGAVATLSGALLGHAAAMLLREATGWSASLSGAVGLEGEAADTPTAILLMAVPVLFLADFLIYVYHRAAHASGDSRRWRMHSVHHSIPHFVLALGARAHALEAVVTYGLCGLAGGLLGAGLGPTLTAGIVMALVMSPHHINCDSDLGPLSKLLVTTEAHRWHHHIDPNDSGNYGLVFSIWDRWLGTYHVPRRFSGRLGLGSDATASAPDADSVGPRRRLVA